MKKFQYALLFVAASMTSIATAAERPTGSFQVADLSRTECTQVFDTCRNQYYAYGNPAVANVEIASKCVPALQQCMQTAESDAVYRRQLSEERRVTGKTVDECRASNQSCEARWTAQLGYQAAGVIATECRPYLEMCTNNALSALAGNPVPGASATVIGIVPIYEAPSSNGNPITDLAPGTRVTLLGPCADGWCQVKLRRQIQGYVQHSRDNPSLTFQ